MKIGKFAEMFHMTPASVRYYMELGLLIPIREGAQYTFDKTCVEDMELILYYKELDFRLNEISQIFSIKRMTNFKDKNANKLYLELLKHKKRDVQESIDRQLENITKLDKKIKEVENFDINYGKTGVPISFLPEFCCPVCNKTLNMKDVNIEKQYVMQGDLSCTCGYHAYIEDGILITEDNGNVPDFSSSLLIQDVNPQLLSFQIKFYKELLGYLVSQEMDGKVIYTMDRFSGGLLLEQALKLYNGNRYIVSYSSLSALKEIKKRIEQQRVDLDVLYVVSESVLLPIKKGIIDIFVDDFSTSNYLFFHDNYPISCFEKYMKRNSYIFGAMFFYKQMSKTMANIQKEYPNASTIKLCSFLEYKRELKRLGYQIENEEQDGSLIEPGGGIEFSFHEKGEEMFLYHYMAKRK